MRLYPSRDPPNTSPGASRLVPLPGRRKKLRALVPAWGCEGGSMSSRLRYGHAREDTLPLPPPRPLCRYATWITPTGASWTSCGLTWTTAPPACWCARRSSRGFPRRFRRRSLRLPTERNGAILSPPFRCAWRSRTGRCVNFFFFFLFFCQETDEKWRPW